MRNSGSEVALELLEVQPDGDLLRIRCASSRRDFGSGPREIGNAAGEIQAVVSGLFLANKKKWR